MIKYIIHYNRLYDNIRPQFLRFMVCFTIIFPVFMIQLYPENPYFVVPVAFYALFLAVMRVWYLTRDHGDLNV